MDFKEILNQYMATTLSVMISTQTGKIIRTYERIERLGLWKDMRDLKSVEVYEYDNQKQEWFIAFSAYESPLDITRINEICALKMAETIISTRGSAKTMTSKQYQLVYDMYFVGS